VILEFCGLPGSGKSTLEAEILPQLERHNFRIVMREELEEEFLRCRILGNSLPGRFVFYGTISLSLIASFLRSGRIRDLFVPVRVRTAYWLLKDVRLYAFFLESDLNSPSSKVVYAASEGIFQHSVNLIAWGGDGFLPLVEQALSALEFDSVRVVLTELPVSEAERRILSRGIPCTWPKQAQSAASIPATLNRYATALGIVMPLIERRIGKMIRVDTEKHTGESVQVVMEALYSGRN